MEFLRKLWRAAKFWPDPQMDGIRPGSGSAVLLMFLILLFAAVGSVLVFLGVDLDTVDWFIDAQGGWLSAAGALLFRGLVWVIFLFSVVIVLGWVFDRTNPEKPGWGTALGAALIAVLLAPTLLAPLD